MGLASKNNIFDDVEYSTFSWIGDFFLEELKFDHEEEIMSFIYELFCMEYEPQHDTFAFSNQCNDLLCASVLAFFSSLAPLSLEPLATCPHLYLLN